MNRLHSSDKYLSQQRIMSSFIGKTVVYFLIVIATASCNRTKDPQQSLLFWCSNNKDEITLASDATGNWNKTNQRQVHMQPIPEGQSSEEVILAAVVGKTTPDIYANMWQGSVEMYARAGVLIPLDTIPGFMEFIRDRCDSNVIQEITSVDGHIYQVPWKVNPIMTIYNKTLFASNQISQVPLSYTAYRESAEKFQNNSRRNGLHSRFGYTEVKAIWYQRLFNFYPLYLAASDGAPLIKDNKAAFNNKHAIGVFAFLQSLYRDEYFSRESSGASTDPFVTQTIATKWTGPWEIPYLKRIPDRDFEFDYAAPPVPDGHTGPVYTYADPKNIVIFNTCSAPRIAWEFIRTMIDKEGDKQLLEVSGQLPRRKNLDTDPFYRDYFASNPMLTVFAKQIPYIKGIDNCESIVEVFDIISQEYEACVVYQKKTPEKAIADAERAVNVLLSAN